MFRPLMQTRPDFAFFLARVGLGASLLPHGLAKIGILLDGSPIDIGGGIQRTVEGFQSAFGLSAPLTYGAIAVEVLGSLLLIFGFFGRLAGLAVAGTMGVAAYMTMDVLVKPAGITAEDARIWWYDNPAIQTTHGAYHILAVAIGLAILIRGSGWLSIDRAMSKSPHP